MAKAKHRGTKAKHRDGRAPERLVPKRNVVTAGHPTSVSLEDAFWDGVKEIAAAKGVSAKLEDYVARAVPALLMSRPPQKLHVRPL